MTVIEHHSSQVVRPRYTRNWWPIPTTASIEMWERFSFYGLQSILAYYIYTSVAEGGLGLPKEQATALVGAYGALLYLCTIAAGWVSDRILGTERTLLAGAILVMSGHIVSSMSDSFFGLIVGLMPIAAGSALIKTAAIAILGTIYDPQSPQRSIAFQAFYLGISIGGLGGPMLTGWLAHKYSYQIGFAAAAFVMGIGLVSHAVLRRIMNSQLPDDVLAAISYPPHPMSRNSAIGFITTSVAVLSIIAWLLGTEIIAPATLSMLLLIVSLSVAAVLFTTISRSPLTTPAEKKKVFAYIPLFLALVTYWILWLQTPGVLAIYSEQRLNRMVGGFEIPASWTQSLAPFYALVFCAPVAWLWAKAARRRGTQSDGLSMSIGIIIAGTGIFLLVPYVGGGTGSTPFAVLALVMLLMTLGKLLISPVGMAATTAHAPRKFATRFSALFYLSLAIGGSIAGSISTFYNPDDPRAELSYLLFIGAVPILLGVLLLAYSVIAEKNL
ncbi:MAG: oligopeptide:H+ symporter [Corynebacterium sp.]|nr:oligopeptide:H+ symporter [Corynebacterium sp.]